MTIAASATNAGAAGDPADGTGGPTGRSLLLLAASFVITSMLAAAQALALLVICGTDARTEAFLAAYALYLPVAVLGASLRASVSGLVADAPVADRAEHASEIASRCILFGGLVAGTVLLLTPLLAPAISHGLPDDVRGVTQVALLLLLPAAFLHVVSASLSGALGAHREFGYSAAVYVTTSVVSLVVSIAMLAAIGPLGAAAGVLTGTVLLAAAHVRHARALGIRVRLNVSALRERAQWRVTTQVLSGAALGFALQANLAISLAALGVQDGAITAYSYAFFIATMILSLSSLPLALVTLPDLVSAVRARGRTAVADHLVRVAPYAYAVVLPIVAGFLGFGRAAVAAVVEPFVDAAVAELMFEMGRALVVMTIPATLFYLASAASLPAATPRDRLLGAGATIGIHALSVTFVWGDPAAVAWAHPAAMTLSTVVLFVQVLRRHALGALARTAREAAPVALAATSILLVGLIASDTDPAITIIGTSGLAAIIYVVALRGLAPAVVEPFIALVRRSATT